jgi:hypothetical protein
MAVYVGGCAYVLGDFGEGDVLAPEAALPVVKVLQVNLLVFMMVPMNLSRGIFVSRKKYTPCRSLARRKRP